MGRGTSPRVTQGARRLVAALSRPVVWWPWLTVVVVVSLYALHALVLKSGADFAVFYRAGSRILAGEPLYRHEKYPFKYAPAVAFLFAPLSVFPETVARGIWLAMSVAAATRFLQLSARLTRSSLPGSHLVVLVLSLPFIQHLLSMGQSDAILLLLMLQSVLWADRSALGSAGLWALACLFKPPYLVFAALAACLKQWRRIAGLALGLAVGMSLTALRYGIRMNVAQIVAWRDLLRETTASFYCEPDIQSVFGIACTYWADPSSGRRFLAGVFALAAVVLFFYVFATVVTWKRDSDRGRILAIALSFHLTAFLSPLGWRGNLFSTAPLIYLLLATYGSRALWPRRLAILGLLAMSIAWLNYDVLGGDLFRRLLLTRYLGIGAIIAALAAAVGQAMLPAVRATSATAAQRAA
jgi:hypothetical protein